MCMNKWKAVIVNENTLTLRMHTGIKFILGSLAAECEYVRRRWCTEKYVDPTRVGPCCAGMSFLLSMSLNYSVGSFLRSFGSHEHEHRRCMRMGFHFMFYYLIRIRTFFSLSRSVFVSCAPFHTHTITHDMHHFQFS